MKTDLKYNIRFCLHHCYDYQGYDSHYDYAHDDDFKGEILCKSSSNTEQRYKFLCVCISYFKPFS